jgi:hypothetical protein
VRQGEIVARAALEVVGERWSLLIIATPSSPARPAHGLVCASCGRMDDPAEVPAPTGPGMPAEPIEFMGKLRAGRSGSSTPMRAEPVEAHA